MNASYKIVLLAAFVVFAAVVGYYVFVPNEGDKAQASDPKTLAQQDPDEQNNPDADDADNTDTRERTPPTRDGLDRRTPPRNPGGDTVVIRPPAQDPIDLRVGDDDTTDDDTTPPRVAIGPGDGATDPITGVRRGPGSTATGTGEARSIDSGTGDTDTGSGTDIETGTDTGESRRGPGVTGDDTETGAGEAETGTGDTTATGDNGTTEDTGDGTTTGTDTATERQPPRRAPNARNYTVEPGDTFASIAVEVYGQESAWFEIAQANPSVDPKRLQVGQVIVLPDLAEVEREREEATPPAPGKDQSYTVRPGDTLSGIAQKFYGDSEAWDLIYNRNRDKIGPSPDTLKAGMTLVIPQAYNGAE
ncbi:MAG: LysM peptidoglycan-binding domain-containing protein [Phycisphaeraceae bacterium]